MLDTKDFINQYYDDAMKIHAFCSDNSISSDDAKLYVYIYVKTKESPHGLDYFNQDCSIEIGALQSMLCKSTPEITTFDEPVTPEQLKEIYSSFVASSLRKLERDAQLQYGFENIIQSELSRRLRLHTDSAYLKKYMDIFINKILPGIVDYTDAKVKISNINYQIKNAHIEKELNFLFE